MNRATIDRFRAQANAPKEAIQGLSPKQLQAFPEPGSWSIQQIVFHLLDSDLIGVHRMKRIASEDRPLLIGYNETLFAQRLFYHDLSLEHVCQLFALNRQLMADLLEKLPGEAFDRIGIHNEHGALTLDQMVQDYIDHVDGHMTHILRKREAVLRM